MVPGFMLVSLITMAQPGVIKLSVPRAKEYALQNNKELKNARKDVLISEEQLIEARGQGLPRLSGNVDYMTNFNYEFELTFGAETAEPPRIDYTKLDPGDIEVLDFINQSFGSTGPSTIVMNDQASAQVRVSQLIFSGQYWVSLQTAKIGKQLSKRNVEISELDVKEIVVNTYYTILVTERLLDIVNENIASLNQIMEHTKNMYQAGMVEETDVDQIRVNISQLENTRNSMRRSVVLSYNMLRIQLGVESGQRIQLTENLEEVVRIVEKDNLLKGSDFDVTENINYQMMEKQEELNEKMIDMEKWAYAPTLTGFYSYTEKILKPNFDLSPNHAAGLTLSVPIFSGWSKQARVNQARIELEKISTSKELLKEQLSMQKNQLEFNLRSAYENYRTQQENVEVAKRVYDNIYTKYKQGLMSSLDLTHANTNYLQAENNYVSSVLDLLQAKLDLEKLYNKL